jgi:hypothetical protein
VPLPVADWGAAPAILLTHFPILSRLTACRDAGLKYAGDLTNRAELAAALAARPAPTIVLHGHLHVRDAVAEGTVFQIGCAALVEPPYELAILDLDRADGRIEVRIVREAVADAGDARLPVLVPERGAWTFDGKSWTPGSSFAPRSAP